MTLRMLDSIYVANLPGGADAYLGYVDGRWATFSELKARFPHTHLLSMAVFASSDADGCDCEAGDLTPAQVPPWVLRQRRRGVARPVVYASASAMSEVMRQLTMHAITRGEVRLLSAHYLTRSGRHWPHICGPSTCAYPGVPACDGTQWTDRAAGAGESLIDESLLLPGFFGGDDDMPLNHADAETLLTADGIVPSPLADPGTNKFWTPASILTDINKQARETRAQVTALTALVQKQAGLDTDAIIAGVLKGLAPDQLAAAIAASLGPDVGQEVLAALQTALAKAAQ